MIFVPRVRKFLRDQMICRQDWSRCPKVLDGWSGTILVPFLRLDPTPLFAQLTIARHRNLMLLYRKKMLIEHFEQRTVTFDIQIWTLLHVLSFINTIHFCKQHKAEICLFWNTNIGKYWDMDYENISKWLFSFQIAS